MSEYRDLLIDLSYFASAILFILGLKKLSSPATARAGNKMAMYAMALALLVTMLDHHIVSYWSILIGTAVGAGIGIYFGRVVKMTDMPQMVALFNGLGGATAGLIGVAEYLKEGGTVLGAGQIGSMALGILIGAISFSGSMIAFAKLQGLMTEKPVRLPANTALNALMLVVALVISAMLTAGQGGMTAVIVLSVLALVLGVTAVLPIGGADMPVVISLLNSFTGVAAALTGFVVENQILVVAGALVGASGTLLTLLMSKAMNRPISNVLFGAFGATAGAASTGAAHRMVKEASAEDVAMAMAYARKVIIVPGYGLAVAQAQHVCREVGDELEKRGVEVIYAIHPVAGRMPGHMNVLLAEANVSYEQLSEMEQVNGDFDSTDVTLVIGANDVVNPAARTDTTSPIYGMPILDVDHSKNVIIMKRSMNAGFAGIDNELFYRDNARMLFGDAKATLTKLQQELARLN